MERQKNRLKGGERSDTYRLPWCMESVKRIDKNLDSLSALAFVNPIQTVFR
jgi:hypothetical protein